MLVMGKQTRLTKLLNKFHKSLAKEGLSHLCEPIKINQIRIKEEGFEYNFSSKYKRFNKVKNGDSNDRQPETEKSPQKKKKRPKRTIERSGLLKDLPIKQKTSTLGDTDNFLKPRKRVTKKKHVINSIQSAKNLRAISSRESYSNQSNIINLKDSKALKSSRNQKSKRIKTTRSEKRIISKSISNQNMILKDPKLSKSKKKMRGQKSEYLKHKTKISSGFYEHNDLNKLDRSRSKRKQSNRQSKFINL